MLNENRIPEGYMENAQGCLVPRANIRPIDIERDASGAYQPISLDFANV